MLLLALIVRCYCSLLLFGISRSSSGSVPVTTRCMCSEGQKTRKFSTSEDEETITEEELKSSILNSSLNHVSANGWTARAIALGAQEHGYPGVAHGLFPRGGGDLLHHFVRQCNDELSKHLELKSKEMQEDSEESSTSIMRNAIEMRLRMLIPYLNHWPQAMALTALPSNVRDHFSNLCRLSDDICYYAGDRSIDFNWYTKRASLLAVYKSCELHLIQDVSHDYQGTWDFLDRRLSTFTMAGSIKEDIDKFVNPEFASALYTVGRNILGVNDQRR